MDRDGVWPFVREKSPHCNGLEREAVGVWWPCLLEKPTTQLVGHLEPDWKQGGKAGDEDRWSCPFPPHSCFGQWWSSAPCGRVGRKDKVFQGISLTHFFRISTTLNQSYDQTLLSTRTGKLFIIFSSQPLNFNKPKVFLLCLSSLTWQVSWNT